MNLPKRTTVEARKAQIVAAAYHLAVDVGLSKVTQELVAERVGVTRALVTVYYKADDLRAAVVEHAINAIDVDTAHRDDYLRIIGCGYVDGVPAALNAPDEIKRAAVNSLLV